MKKFLHALKLGYGVLQQLEKAGVQLPKVAGLPVDVYDNAAKAGARVILDAHKAQGGN